MGWWNDLDWSLSGVTVKKTGARIDFDKSLLSDLTKWLLYAAAERLRMPMNIHAVSYTHLTLPTIYSV